LLRAPGRSKLRREKAVAELPHSKAAASLYHGDHFMFVNFPPAVKKKILALAGAA